ncbi:MAG: glycosyltransferase [Lentisphaerae bacterium]|nr:glycosyltransferase [Lentisphaerota bacterium]
MKALFFICIALLAYTYAGYALLLFLLRPLATRLRKPVRSDDAFLPPVSVVCALHNEEAHVERLVAAFANSRYPRDKLEVLLADDCSTDRTRALIREAQQRHPFIKLVPFDDNIGKTAVVNALVPTAQAELIAFCDANTFYEPDALARMTRHFADPRVGTVCGRLLLRSRTGVNTDDQYWAYESAVKRLEGDFGVVLGANGGIYMLRKRLFTPLRPDVIQIDDFIWPVLAQSRGFIGVYDPHAVAREEAAPFVEAEFRRKIRIGTGAYRALRDLWRILPPAGGMLGFCYVSHKVIRWLAPFLLLLLLAANSRLLPQAALYGVLLALQGGFYGLALCGPLFSRQRAEWAKFLRFPYYFVGSNTALLIGLYRCVTGRQSSTWSSSAHRGQQATSDSQ